MFLLLHVSTCETDRHQVANRIYEHSIAHLPLILQYNITVFTFNNFTVHPLLKFTFMLECCSSVVVFQDSGKSVSE
jgi:hypothetical protein